jgi:tetratricopeptide (TPR) repeat protein
MIHHAAGDAAGAYAAYLEAIKADPKLAIAFNNLAALAADRKERLDEALGWARQAVALEPGRPEFQDTLATVQRARGERPASAEPKKK